MAMSIALLVTRQVLDVLFRSLRRRVHSVICNIEKEMLLFMVADKIDSFLSDSSSEITLLLWV